MVARWTVSPSSINILYNGEKNQVVLPGGILQQPFFDVTFPRAINFGSMGLFFGHELAHGFDADGRLYDCDGNKRQWLLKNDIIERQNERFECFVNQYSSYSMNGHPIFGTWTLSKLFLLYLLFKAHTHHKTGILVLIF